MNNFDTICRACLIESTELQLIHDINLGVPNNETKLDIIALFKKYCDIDVNHLDNKPQKICKLCISLFSQFYCFLEKVTLSNQIFDTLLGNVVSQNSCLDLKDEIEDIKSEVLSEKQIILNNKIEDGSETYISDTGEQYTNSDNDLDCKPSKNEFSSEDSNVKLEVSTNKLKVERKKSKSKELKCISNVKFPIKNLKETQYDGAFSCKLCDNKELGEIDTVIEHYEKYHLEDLQCILCLRTFTKHVPLFHIGLHSKKSYVCRPCRLLFRTKEQYDDHNMKYDHDKSLSCRICGKSFTRNYKKNKHMLSHLKEKNYSCSKCGKTFTYKTSLVRHFKIHFGKRFLCSSCGNAYTTKFMLQRHYNIMHKNVDVDGKPLPKPPPKPVHLQCEFCGEVFTTKYGYGRHIRRHPEFNQHKCKICSAMYDNKDQLDEHMEIKHNKYTCEVCGRRFPFESELKTHFRKHEDMEMARFRCEICGKTARTSTQLKVHLRIHTGERPFSCKICGKSFKQTAHLKVHMYQHTGKMPFKCKICEKTFPFQHIMEIHMRTHTGEKPFQCISCGNAYHDKTTMQKHQKKKHPEMPLQKVVRSEYKMTKLM